VSALDSMTFASARMRGLFREIESALGGRRGWQRTAARACGLSPSFVSKVLNDDQAIGSDSILRLVARGVPEAFFDSTWATDEAGSEIVDALLAGVDAATDRKPCVARAPIADVVADTELAVMAALAALTPDARSRVLRYAQERWK
jgi:hypothetical protein